MFGHAWVTRGGIYMAVDGDKFWCKTTSFRRGGLAAGFGGWEALYELSTATPEHREYKTVAPADVRPGDFIHFRGRDYWANTTKVNTAFAVDELGEQEADLTAGNLLSFTTTEAWIRYQDRIEKLGYDGAREVLQSAEIPDTATTLRIISEDALQTLEGHGQ